MPHRSNLMTRSITCRKSDFPSSQWTLSSETPPEIEISGWKTGGTLATPTEHWRCIIGVLHRCLAICSWLQPQY